MTGAPEAATGVGVRPLEGVRVVELAGLAPSPFAGMLLADLGADVELVTRPGQGETAQRNPLFRGRSVTAIDLKDPVSVTGLVARLGEVDVFLEGFRPGVAERLGLGPAHLADVAPHLVYARLSGWGQDGPLAQRAGHDINYLAMSGALAAITPMGELPRPPLNLLGDFGGGGMLAVVGILAGLAQRHATGRGLVVDVAISEGVALTMASWFGRAARAALGQGDDGDLIDGSAPFYRCYTTSDGGYVSVGAIEPAFYANLLRVLDPPGVCVEDQYDRSSWPQTTAELAAAFAGRSREQWTAAFASVDACVFPVLTPEEATTDEAWGGRRPFRRSGGTVGPVAAPRFSPLSR